IHARRGPAAHAVAGEGAAHGGALRGADVSRAGAVIEAAGARGGLKDGQVKGASAEAVHQNQVLLPERRLKSHGRAGAAEVVVSVHAAQGAAVGVDAELGVKV